MRNGWFNKVLRATAATVMGASVLAAGGTGAQAAVPDGVALAVTGANRALYVQTAGSSSWTNLGGQLLSAPAVASWGGVTHYVGTGTNKTLYHRTNTTGWHRLGPAYCTDVSATAAERRVFLSCRGGNGALYTTDFDATLQRPATPTMTKIGGSVLGAVPVMMTEFGVMFLARAASYTEAGETFNTYTWTEEFGFQRFYVRCDSTPAMVYSMTTDFMACQQGAGVVTVEAGYYPSEPEESDFNIYDVPGQVINTPALALTGEGTAELFVQGSNGAVYHRGLSVDGPTGAGWTKINSIVIGGVAAATLS